MSANDGPPGGKRGAVEVELHGAVVVVDVEADGEPLQPHVVGLRPVEVEVIVAIHSVTDRYRNKYIISKNVDCISNIYTP